MDSLLGFLGMISKVSGIFTQFLAFEDVIYRLEGLGLFTFILPFLLLFAIVFGVLNWTNMFGGHKGVHVIIALVIGLLGIRFPIYSDFLAIVSPKLGVGLVIILSLVILIGLFVPDKAQAIIGWIMIGIGVIIAIVIFAQTYQILGPGTGFVGGSDLVAWVILIGIIVAVVVGNNADNEAPSTDLGRLWKTLAGKKGK